MCVAVRAGRRLRRSYATGCPATAPAARSSPGTRTHRTQWSCIAQQPKHNAWRPASSSALVTAGRRPTTESWSTQTPAITPAAATEPGVGDGQQCRQRSGDKCRDVHSAGAIDSGREVHHDLRHSIHLVQRARRRPGDRSRYTAPRDRIGARAVSRREASPARCCTSGNGARVAARAVHGQVPRGPRPRVWRTGDGSICAWRRGRLFPICNQVRPSICCPAGPAADVQRMDAHDTRGIACFWACTAHLASCSIRARTCRAVCIHQVRSWPLSLKRKRAQGKDRCGVQILQQRA